MPLHSPADEDRPSPKRRARPPSPSQPGPPSAPKTSPRERALRAQLAALPFLPQSWRRPGGLPETETVWRYLQEWVPQVSLHMDELEGYLLSVRREPAFAAFDPEGTLDELARVRSWLQQLQKCSDWASFVEQLCSRPVLVAAYQRMANLLAFFRGPQRSRLVAIYGYLTDEGLALPEGEPFRELRDLRATLMDMLADSRTLEDVQERQRLWDGFDAFLFRYKRIYAREHDRFRRPEVLAPYARLRERPQFQLLQRLRKLNGAPVRAALEDLEDRISRILATQCPGVDESWLDVRPTCTCGYRLDARPPESLANLETDLEQALVQGLRLFRDPEVRRRLNLARQVLADTGKAGEASKIARLLEELDTSAEPDPAGLDVLLDDATIAVLNWALNATAPVVPRPLDTLVEELAGKEWSWEQLQEAVALWAFGEAHPPPGRLVLPLWSAEAGRGSRARRPRRSDAAREAAPETARMPQTFSEWEDYYRDLVQQAVRNPREGGSERARYQQAFREFYRRFLGEQDGSSSLVALSLFEPRQEEGLLAGLQKPLTLPLVLRRAMEWLASADAGPRRLLWIDALRYDVWLQALHRLEGNVELIEGGLLWAWPPATTAGQMARLDAQGIRFHFLEVNEDPATFPVPARADAGRAPVPVVYLRVLEEAISRQDPPSQTELVDLLVQCLRPLLLGRPESQWLVLGDHGFVGLQMHDASSGRETRVWSQGGDSMEEVLVPWAHLQVTAG